MMVKKVEKEKVLLLKLKGEINKKSLRIFYGKEKMLQNKFKEIIRNAKIEKSKNPLGASDSLSDIVSFFKDEQSKNVFRISFDGTRTYSKVQHVTVTPLFTDNVLSQNNVITWAVVETSERRSVLKDCYEKLRLHEAIVNEQEKENDFYLITDWISMVRTFLIFFYSLRFKSLNIT